MSENYNQRLENLKKEVDQITYKDNKNINQSSNTINISPFMKSLIFVFVGPLILIIILLILRPKFIEKEERLNFILLFILLIVFIIISMGINYYIRRTIF